LFDSSINTIKENKQTFYEASRDVGLQINEEKTKYMIMSLHPKSREDHTIRIANESFQNVAKFKYFGTKLTNKNNIHDEIEGALNWGNVYYNSIQNALSFCLLSKNLKIKIYKAIILPLVLHGCETWSFSLREKHK
jgi:predicted transcriptional regulator